MWALSVLLSLIVAVTGHALACRMPVAGNIVTKFLRIGGLTGLFLGGFEILRHGLSLETWAALLLYGFACELYIFLFTLVSNSVSTSILIALRAGHLTRAEVDRRYSVAYMVNMRMEMLLADGFLRRDPAGYALTPRARVVLYFFKRARRFFRLSSSGEALGPTSGLTCRSR